MPSPIWTETGFFHKDVERVVELMLGRKIPDRVKKTRGRSHGQEKRLS